MPRLPVGKQRRRQIADRLHVQIAQRAAARIGEKRRIRIDLLDLRIPQPPQIEQPLFVPQNVLPAHRILRIRCARQILAGVIVEQLWQLLQ